MDKWILSTCQSLIKFVKAEMKLYHLYTVTPRLLLFIEQLTKWYLRLNKKRLKGEEGALEWEESLTTLFSVIFNMVKLMSSFTPFITEYMYQNLKTALAMPKHININNNKQLSKYLLQTESVHYLLLPEYKHDYVDTVIDNGVKNMQTVIELGWTIREKNSVPLKQPLRTFVIISDDQEIINLTTPYTSYIKEELNVQEIVWSNEPIRFGYYRGAEPEFQILGLRVKGSMPVVTERIRRLDEDSILKLKSGEIDQLAIEGFQIGPGDIHTVFKKKEEHFSFFEAQSDENVLVLLSVCPTYQLINDGAIREITNRVQRLRKFMKLSPTDSVDICYNLQSARFIGCSDKLVSHGKTVVQGHLIEWLNKLSVTVVDCSMEPGEAYSMLECCVAWLQAECINKLEECFEEEKLRVLVNLKSQLEMKDEKVCKEVLEWSLEYLSSLTNQKATSNCRNAINTLISNFGKPQIAADPKSKVREYPKNYRNAIEKETKLEPKEVAYFASEVESRFIEVARLEGVDVSHEIKDFEAKLEAKLQELYIYAETRLLYDIKSFSKEANPLPVDRKQSLVNNFITDLKPKLFLWMDQLQIMNELLQEFGGELNSKCFPIEIVTQKNIPQLILEKTVQKPNSTRLVRLQLGLIESKQSSCPLCSYTTVTFQGNIAVVMLENPKGVNIPAANVVANITNIFGLQETSLTQLLNKDCKLANKIIHLNRQKHGIKVELEETNEPIKCCFVNVQTRNLREDSKATILLENPQGKNYILSRTDLVKKIKVVCNINHNIQVHQGTSLLPYSWENVDSLSNKSLTVQQI
ncbi:Isoleucine--tRNA ligase, cytoplasmic [Oopsacas minuta]|uniref:Isoleucine--tRNA ligase, cytoplasmic n=1 Tax=Oopsacas minuta TaxID=111878 RepID=A0AAV7K1L6_9METZ|nr:Isoleucine--tRNA ligase, cytoplasmic [Oopsacas minuta]